MLALEKNLIFSPLLSYSSNFVTDFAVAPGGGEYSE